jgi:DMSO/TMAO reductase YedYZ molybdopterin-dependent catalytic subunit
MKFFALIFLIFSVTFLVSLNGCFNYSPVKQLNRTEVRDYNGERLDSVNNFRENSIKGPQYVDINNYTLEISGLVDNPKSYTYNEVLAHQAYSKVVTINCVEGWSVKILWQGVLLKDLLNEAGVKQGALTVIFHAYDGYTSSLPLDYVMNNNIILAYEMNNVTLPPERGFPFQVVAEDKWGYKWVKWVTEIEISGDPNYKGYWESNGYSNSGNLNESFFK